MHLLHAVSSHRRAARQLTALSLEPRLVSVGVLCPSAHSEQCGTQKSKGRSELLVLVFPLLVLYQLPADPHRRQPLPRVLLLLLGEIGSI